MKTKLPKLTKPMLEMMRCIRDHGDGLHNYRSKGYFRGASRTRVALMDRGLAIFGKSRGKVDVLTEAGIKSLEDAR